MIMTKKKEISTEKLVMRMLKWKTMTRDNIVEFKQITFMDV